MNLPRHRLSPEGGDSNSSGHPCEIVPLPSHLPQPQHTETQHALRTLLGGVWARENPETVAHLAQDNWYKGAFVWRQAFTEKEADL